MDDVPEPGDATPREVAGKSVIMTRDTAGAVHVFHNYCRHRGLKILTEAVRGRSRFTCPYHAWTYALDGRLVRAPHFDGPGRHSAEPVDGLARVRSAVWHRLVFVNLSGDAQDFADYIAPLERRWARYDLRTLRRAESRACDLEANWKLAVENFIDYYHLPYVHKGLNRYSPMEDHYPIQEGDCFFGQGNAHYAASDEASRKLPSFPGLGEAEQSVTEAICLFPNLLVTIFNDNMRIILVEPNGAARCHERIEVFVAGDEAAAPAVRPGAPRARRAIPVLQRRGHRDRRGVAGRIRDNRLRRRAPLTRVRREHPSFPPVDRRAHPDSGALERAQPGPFPRADPRSLPTQQARFGLSDGKWQVVVFASVADSSAGISPSSCRKSEHTKVEPLQEGTEERITDPAQSQSWTVRTGWIQLHDGTNRWAIV